MSVCYCGGWCVCATVEDGVSATVEGGVSVCYCGGWCECVLLWRVV